jgi:hypothetical protein
MIAIPIVLILILVIVLIFAAAGEKPALIPLKNAILCIECESMFEDSNQTCPVCGSKFSWPIANWIGTMNQDPNMVKTPMGWRHGEQE